MRKLALVFPGQGAQYVGMGKDFYERFPEARRVYETASRVTGLDLPKICFEENEQIHKTEYTQIAMLATELAMFYVWKEKGINADIYAGLSLGEYGAIVAAGALSMEDAFRIVRKRGILMQEAVPSKGAMYAILGVNGEAAEAVCAETEGIVDVANYNCPGQIVITGEETAVQAAAEKMKKVGAKRVLPLKVSGPFHSILLKEAGAQLGTYLESISMQPLKQPYLTNVTADYVTDHTQIKGLLSKQIYAPVRWEQSVQRMIAAGVDTFVEIGPGRTLTGFLKKIDRKVTGWKIETVEDLDQVCEKLKMEEEKE